MSLVKAQDKTLAKRRRASQRLSSRSRLKIRDPRETTRHGDRKATPSVATRIDATPTHDSVFANMSPDKPQDTTLENRCRASRRLQKTPHLAHVSIRMPLETKLENRRRESRHQSSRRHQRRYTSPRWASGCHGTRRWKIDAARSDSPKTPQTAQMNLGMP
jgi:hypothetical protein